MLPGREFTVSEQVVDARGLSCPQPVIMSRDAVKKLESGGAVEVLVDTVTSRDNVRRAVENVGCTVEIQEEGDEFRLLIKK
jgi:tRNA 2-thiouridine synthesizing protein A